MLLLLTRDTCCGLGTTCVRPLLRDSFCALVLLLPLTVCITFSTGLLSCAALFPLRRSRVASQDTHPLLSKSLCFYCRFTLAIRETLVSAQASCCYYYQDLLACLLHMASRPSFSGTMLPSYLPLAIGFRFHTFCPPFSPAHDSVGTL